MSRPSEPSIIDLMNDRNLFGLQFRSPSWNNWRVFLKALFCLPMTKSKLRTFSEFTRREGVPRIVEEAWLMVGRRAGKSFIAAFVAVFLACFRDYSPWLAPGEVATIMVIAADRKQARVIMRYILGFLESIPMLEAKIAKKNLEMIELDCRVVIEVHTASFRSVRGYTLAAVICDEVAYWRSDQSAAPDREIVNALKPSLATIPHSLLIALSSPYSKKGMLYQRYRKNYGKSDSSTLIWRADTRSMNPTISEKIIQSAYEEDPVAAASEWGAQFRRDVESFVSEAAVTAVTIAERHELPPVEEIRYYGYCDPAGGSGKDSMTVAIAHMNGNRLILDAVREVRPPFSPSGVCDEFATLLRTYRVFTVTGDKYGGEFVGEQFLKRGIQYETSNKSKSELYSEMLPLINSGQIELLDHPVLISQLCNLERRTGRAGRDSIDHLIGGKDDVVNSCAGVFCLLSGRSELRFLDLSAPILPEYEEQLEKEVQLARKALREQRERKRFDFFGKSLRDLKKDHF